jgi:hypothetical protein
LTATRYNTDTDTDTRLFFLFSKMALTLLNHFYWQIPVGREQEAGYKESLSSRLVSSRLHFQLFDDAKQQEELELELKLELE